MSFTGSYTEVEPIFYNPHFLHSSFSTLCVFHTLHFPHSIFFTFCTPRFPRNAPINVKPLGGRLGIGGGFDSNHCPVVRTFDCFNGLSSNILLTFSCYFDNPQMLWGGAFEQKLSAQFKCPAYARPPPRLPQQLNIDRCITLSETVVGLKAVLTTCSLDFFIFTVNIY